MQTEDSPELTYGALHEFVQKHGKPVDVMGQPASVTVLPDGAMSAHRLIEKDATHFRFDGKTYTRAEFMQLVRESRTPQ
jgi:hypothetical protein